MLLSTIQFKDRPTGQLGSMGRALLQYADPFEHGGRIQLLKCAGRTPKSSVPSTPHTLSVLSLLVGLSEGHLRIDSVDDGAWQLVASSQSSLLSSKPLPLR